MRSRACLRLGFLALGASLIAAVVTDARAADMAGNGVCTLPTGTGIACQIDKDCAIYGNAVCNQAVMLCACGGVADMSSTFGGNDGGGGTGGSGGGFTGGSQGSVPIIGGGMTFPTRTGCSYVPGSR